MILDEYFNITWQSSIKNHYVSKGYVFTKIGDVFKINVSDLKRNSVVKICVKCDICGKEKILTHLLYNINTKDNSTYYSCSNKCSMEKNNETNLKKYGTKYPQKLESVKEKMKQTNLKKYGVEYSVENEEIKKKIKQTNLKKYGVENIQKLDFIKEKKKQTNLKNCGCEHNFSSESTKEKMKQTNLKKYGVEYITQFEGHIRKRRQTNLKKYSVEYPLQNEKIKQKLINTMIKRYGEVWLKKVPSYNPNSIIYLDILSKKLGLPIQHALNGGEKKFIRYWIDGYIEKHNICIEWDEHYHKYIKENDIFREQFLKENFRCNIIRINEKEFLGDVENQIIKTINLILKIIYENK